MNTLLASQVGELLATPAPPREAPYESPLRVGAGTLQRAGADAVSATTILGIVGADDQSSFEALVDQIAREYEIEARIRWHGQSFSVRFCRPLVVQPAAVQLGAKQLLPEWLSRFRLGTAPSDH